MALNTWIGLGLLLAAVVLAVKEMTREARPLCTYCGLSSCPGEPCVVREHWAAREAAVLAKLDAVLNNPNEDLYPWRDYLESL